jgi:hypothetical protein
LTLPRCEAVAVVAAAPAPVLEPAAGVADAAELVGLGELAGPARRPSS